MDAAPARGDRRLGRRRIASGRCGLGGNLLLARRPHGGVALGHRLHQGRPQHLIALQARHQLGPDELELEVLRAVALGVGRRLARRGFRRLAVARLVGPPEASEQGRQPDAAADARLQERPRIRLERIGLHLHQVDLRTAVLHLAELVEPAEDVLEETRPLALRRRRQVAQVPLVVEPHVGAVHAQVQQVVQVLAARDPRVERRAHERRLVDGEAAAAHVVAARKPRPLHGVRDPGVERLALLPEMVVPLVLALGEERPFGVEVVARLGEDGDALLGELAQPVHRLLEELGIVHHLVVVEEHHGIEAQRVGYRQPEVPDGAVAGEADLPAELAHAQLLEALLQDGLLGSAHHRDGQLREARRRLLDLIGRLRLDGRLADDQQDDLADALGSHEGLQKARQLALLRQGRHVVVGGQHAAAFAAATGGNIGGHDDDGVHAHPSARVHDGGSSQTPAPRARIGASLHSLSL